jgi:hypothetical protein
MENVNRNLRNRLHNNIQSYTRGRVNRGSANSKNFVNTINEIINVIHRGKVPGPRPRRNNLPPNLPPRPRRNNLPSSNLKNNLPPNLPPRPRRNNLPSSNLKNILNQNQQVQNYKRNPTNRGARNLKIKYHPDRHIYERNKYDKLSRLLQDILNEFPSRNSSGNRNNNRNGSNSRNRQLALRPGNNNRQLALRPGNNNRQLALRPGNNNRQLALRPGNPINRNGNTFFNSRNNQPWLKNMAQMRGAALMNNERRAARNL